MRVVWYHGNCWDGFGAAYAVWKRWGYCGVTYQAVYYALPVPELPAGTKELLLLDFTYPRAEMERLRDSVNSMTVIDHHVTAQQNLEGFKCDVKIFDMERSGCYLTFRHFWPELGPEDVPLLFDYLQDRDLWRFELPHSREINAYIKSFPYDFAVWVKIEQALQHDFKRSVQDGEAILRFQHQTVEMICDQVRHDTIGEHQVPIVNSSAFWSEVGQELIRRFPDAPFVVSYFDTAEGKRVHSLRSPASFDCSAVARKFGGGGHRQAAGFTVPIGTPLVAVG